MEAICYLSFTDFSALFFPTKRVVAVNSATLTSTSRASFIWHQHNSDRTIINVRYLKVCTNAVSSSSSLNPRSSVESYLINNLGFSPDSALEASKEVHFNTSHDPDSVVDLFRNWGFSNPNLHHIITKEPWLLFCNPHKRILPKFQFLLSKGASASDIVFIVTKTPRFLRRSLENHIVPTYELLHRFLRSDEETLACIIRNTLSFCCTKMRTNVKLLVDFGVSDSNIVILLRKWPSVFSSDQLLKEVVELKEFGFDPSKSAFGIALLARITVRKPNWDDKVGVFKKWGWCDETVLEAFRRQPNCMMASCDKINAVMGFWVNELGWDAKDLVRGTNIFGFSLEKRIIPRAVVIQYLLAKGLIHKNASLITPFIVSEEMFLQKFVRCFKEDETFHLLKLYQEKMNLQDCREEGCIQQSSKG